MCTLCNKNDCPSTWTVKSPSTSENILHKNHNFQYGKHSNAHSSANTIHKRGCQTRIHEKSPYFLFKLKNIHVKTKGKDIFRESVELVVAGRNRGLEKRLSVKSFLSGWDGAKCKTFERLKDKLNPHYSRKAITTAIKSAFFAHISSSVTDHKPKNY